jgi:hypothetical protein
MAVLIENLLNRLITQQLAVEQRAKCSLDGGNGIRREPAPLQTSRVNADQARTVSTRHHCKRRHVLSDFRARRDESMGADTAELMHPAHTGGHDPFLQHAMAGDFRRIRNDRVVPDLAIVRDVSVVHQQHMIAYTRNHPAAGSAAMNRRELADTVVVTDFQTRSFALILQILRVGTNGGKLEDPIASSDGGLALDYGIGTDYGLGSDADVGANDGTGTDADAGIEFRATVNYRGRMNLAYGSCSSTSIADNSASAASSPSTRASACIFQSG